MKWYSQVDFAYMHMGAICLHIFFLLTLTSSHGYFQQINIGIFYFTNFRPIQRGYSIYRFTCNCWLKNCQMMNQWLSVYILMRNYRIPLPPIVYVWPFANW